MFANELNQQQKQAVFDLAVNLANADNDLSEGEIEYLKNFSSTFDIVYDLDKESMNIDNTLVVFSDRKSKIILLQQLMKISYKDGHFDKKEQDKVFMIAQKIGLNNPELILRIERWVRSGIDWEYEGAQILEDGV